MANNNRNRPLVTGAQDGLDRLKYEVAQEVGWSPSTLGDLQQKIDNTKYEVAAGIGVPLERGYNGDLPSRDAGAVGGRLGGRLGGQMVRHMLAFAEQALSGRQQ